MEPVQALERRAWCSRGTVTEEPSTRLLQTRAPASRLTVPCLRSAPPAKKDKADDGRKGKILICKSTKYINLFGQGERGKNSSAEASHFTSFARSLLL